MARGKKSQKEMLEEIRAAQEKLGPEATTADLMAAIEEMAVEKGLTRPDIERNPEAKAAAEVLVAWCAEHNKRITVTEEDYSVRSPRKKKEEEDEDE